jgi:hypothetical protein
VATSSWVRVRPAAPVRPPGPPAQRTSRRPGAARPFVITSTPRRRAWHSLRPGRCCRVWIALLGAAFSLVIIGVMAGAAVVCANHTCLTDPSRSRAVLHLDIEPTPARPMTLGPLPTTDPAR